MQTQIVVPSLNNSRCVECEDGTNSVMNCRIIILNQVHLYCVQSHSVTYRTFLYKTADTYTGMVMGVKRNKLDNVRLE